MQFTGIQNYDLQTEIQIAVQNAQYGNMGGYLQANIGQDKYSSQNKSLSQDSFSSDQEEDFLPDRNVFLNEQVTFLYDQIKDRKDLFDVNMDHIDSQSVGIDSKIMVLDEKLINRQFDDPNLLRRKGNLESELHALHTERRREKLSLWGDLMKVYKDISEVAEELSMSSPAYSSGDLNGQD